jgi:3-oxoacyl-[acyl-carrier protein] reductase
MDELKGKVALVTGGSRGLGRAMAQAFGALGINVAVGYHTHEVEACDICDQIAANGTGAMPVRADVSKGAEVRRMVEAVEARFGQIDILVNNVGIVRYQRPETLAEQDWDEVVNTNLKSAFLVTQAVLPGMQARGWGRIINLSSVAAQNGGLIGPHFAASKAGILGLTHFYASVGASDGVTVNAIAPALIHTEVSGPNQESLADLLPVGRLGKADEVAAVAVMLAHNGFITGQTINVNGGWVMS